MNYAELTTRIQSEFTSSLHKVAPRGHYSFHTGRVNFMPQTKAQAKAHVNAINTSGFDDLLMVGQWVELEQFLNKHGYKGDYKLTKSHTMCRLQNIKEYVAAIKLEFSL
jgi:hypothetical protein